MKNTLTLLELWHAYSVARLGRLAAVQTVFDDFSRYIGRRLRIGQIYSTLDRMEQHGLVESRVETATGRDGKLRDMRFYTLTSAGTRALNITETQTRLMKSSIRPILPQRNHPPRTK